MKRLTQNDFDMCKECPDNLRCEHASNETFSPCGDKAIYERLKAYERTGMDPEDVKLMIYCAHEDHEPLSTAYHIRELLQAEQEGRIRILPQSESGTCGSCGHFKRIPGRRCGTCDVRSSWTNRRGQIEEHRGTFTPSQSRKACKQYVPREEAEAALSAEYQTPYDRAGDDEEEAALDGGGNAKTAEEPEWKKRMMQTFLGGR